MSTTKRIRKLLSKMTFDLNENAISILKELRYLKIKDECKSPLLHTLVADEYDEDECFLAIMTLLDLGFSPNLADDNEFGYNFIQTALYTGYSEDFIMKIIKESLNYDLDVNYTSYNGETIMHSAIDSDNYLGEIISIYDLLCEQGFDSTKTDYYGMSLMDILVNKSRYSALQIREFERSFRLENKRIYDSRHKSNKTTENNSNSQNNVENNKNSKIPKNDILQMEKSGEILTEKEYLYEPAIGRDKEIRNLIITLALEKKRPLIVGESGVGKTSLADELAYKIQMGQVPEFLKDKIVLEVNPSELVAGCKYRGDFEENITKLMKICTKHDVILFIDEIHTIYGVGSAEGKDTDMAAMLKFYIDRSNLKVFGTTTEKEYNEYFSNDALKRRFEKITIKEPSEDILYQIIDKVINNYCLKNSITFEDDGVKEQIEEIIVSATDKPHRVYKDIINNPDLSISIIDKAFAFAKAYDSAFIKPEHFIESFELCDRIYDFTKKEAILELKNLSNCVTESTPKVLTLDFNRYKK